MGKKFRDNWGLGFLALLSFLSLRYFETNNWLDLVRLVWLVWIIYFIPVNKK
ncbi:MAG: hypothetical protein N4A38_03125 [Candidatus Gracilibacteria bacterium]|nr:hypothetical protein [Candidatus Gracilibacteria bacterium]